MARSDWRYLRDVFTLFIVWGLSAGICGSMPHMLPCPADYRRRVETCIMEAQMAPQAGGGITLVLHKDTMADLCERGLLRKTIDCLQELHSRCQLNSSVLQDLDRLYSVPRWQQGEQLLCEDVQLFQRHFDCLSRSARAVTSCILLRTHTFRMGLTFADPTNHQQVKDVTCSFAESVVRCVSGSMEGLCPPHLLSRLAGGMRFLLPPLCISHLHSDANVGGNDVRLEGNNVTIDSEEISNVTRKENSVTAIAEESSGVTRMENTTMSGEESTDVTAKGNNVTSFNSEESNDATRMKTNVSISAEDSNDVTEKKNVTVITEDSNDVTEKKNVMVITEDSNDVTEKEKNVTVSTEDTNDVAQKESNVTTSTETITMTTTRTTTTTKTITASTKSPATSTSGKFKSTETVEEATPDSGTGSPSEREAN